ncbi:MAG TPA: ribosomal-processing cysteine protease Prp [Aminivibrio sp.]|jgi:uncharacterized protein YsxB (DUF464 family)|uniref:ribosomal-processing cysteine protease Prp n=1 Tax=Aminivibrio sp. TaxID=1872489 RepID=UPI002B1EEE7D|nr:ribosomal-processing cysteine protease Prp [Aminivibrio sp.]MEA4951095.1 ribosomal-processing cysteine protease Prp [Aminivibrio sp.]HPF84373.1 ribosomal-processing cysteine protease Prp [Aminivibrio sp.]HPK06679.1 ribosomal-processing cysteine protease Prp [Aminivibrio sp.]HRX25201.1 ribosomal-processing cysteine protease Prp [Aminivibrio sp.]
MTEISVGLQAGRKVAIVAAGHTGFSERGSDVVCAGVSALVQALYYGFHEVLKQKELRSSVDKKNAKMSLDWAECPASEVDVLAETIIGSLKEIARVYPDHVRIVEVHVDELDF